jgi:hypothetical protein
MNTPVREAHERRGDTPATGSVVVCCAHPEHDGVFDLRERSHRCW